MLVFLCLLVRIALWTGLPVSLPSFGAMGTINHNGNFRDLGGRSQRKVGLGLGTLALLLALCLAGSAHTEPVTQDAGRAESANEGEKQPPADVQPKLALTIQDILQRIARAIEAGNNKQETAEERKRAERDLDAQETMAQWARYVAWVAGAEALITLVGVFLVWRTLRHTRTAALAAQAAVTEAQNAVAQAKRQANDAGRASARELRAYISVVPLGINRLAGKEFGMGHVGVRNVGKLPARNVAVVVRMEGADWRTAVFDVPPDLPPTDRVVQPGAEMRQGSRDEIGIGALCAADNYTFVWGVVYYDDGYGVRRFTRFCHRYHGASYTRRPHLGFVRSEDTVNANALMNEWERQPIIDPEKARYHESGNDAN
jgi:hypothetical protein